MSSDEPADGAAAELVDTKEAYQPSYRVLWFPIAIVIWFVVSVVVVTVAPENEHSQALHLGPGGSLLVVYVFGLAPLAVVVLLAAVRAARHAWIARREDRALRRTAALEPGPVVVAGRVQPRRGSATPVRIEVEQHATGGVGWDSVRWEEVARRVRFAEFDVRLPSGDLLAVAPDERLLLMDDLDETVELDDGKRLRVASLTAGEAVYAVGELGESDEPVGLERTGYRTAPRRGFLLTRTARGRLVLSSKPLGERFRLRCRSERRWAVATACAVVLLQGALFLSYHARALFGVTQHAKVVRLEERTDPEGGTLRQVHAQTIEPPYRFVIERSSDKTYRKLREGEVIVVRLVPGLPSFDQIGRHPTANALLFVPVVWVVGLWLLAYAFVRRPRAWYEKSKLVEIEPAAPTKDRA